MNKNNPTSGVYFLANNKVFEQVVAFLRSFRMHNPTIPLCLIPFDSDFDKISSLKTTFSFSIFDDAELLASCDAISERFHGFVLGTYRKLVAWEGIFDTFIYIDVDTVVTDSVDFAFEHLKHGDYVASHSNLENIRCWVWKDSVYATHLLTPPQIEYSANTGFFVSRRGLLPMKHCVAKVNGALELKESMELECMEQPFLNYLIVTSGYSYTSLLQLLMVGIAPTVSLEWWAGTPNGRVDGGKLYDPRGAGVFLVHWAGFWKKSGGSSIGLPYKELWDFYRRPEISPDVL
ncbi:hypothetical protein ACEN88_02425 [Massilia sp. CT11-108]|uniref:hypothetical protein n=1 Tax=Massilia sp. CT11-108 TaxID=3393900 RepID=UPI0039A6F413